jgi:hypothetical protein
MRAKAKKLTSEGRSVLEFRLLPGGFGESTVKDFGETPDYTTKVPLFSSADRRGRVERPVGRTQAHDFGLEPPVFFSRPSLF